MTPHTHYKVKHKTSKEKIVTIEEWVELSARSNNWTIIERLTNPVKAEMPVANKAALKTEMPVGNPPKEKE